MRAIPSDLLLGVDIAHSNISIFSRRRGVGCHLLVKRRAPHPRALCARLALSGVEGVGFHGRLSLGTFMIQRPCVQAVAAPTRRFEAIRFLPEGVDH